MAVETRIASQFEMYFEEELIAFGDGLDMGVKERKESRMTQIFVLSHWVDGGSISDVDKGEESSTSGEKIQEFCLGHVEFKMPSK